MMAKAALAALAMLLAGCASQLQHPGGPQGPAPGAGEVQQEKDLFRRTLQTQGYTKEENYFPAFSSERVALRGAIEAQAGSVWVYVMDGSARLWVFNKTFAAPAKQGISFVSDPPGSPGTWMVSLCFRGFTGSLSLEVVPAAAAGPLGEPWRGGACPA